MNVFNCIAMSIGNKYKMAQMNVKKLCHSTLTLVNVFLQMLKED